LDPATRESLLRLKQALDPRGILNPGNLGWE
jgi:FAD/FMN-containing dehydrogenase